MKKSKLLALVSLSFVTCLSAGTYLATETTVAEEVTPNLEIVGHTLSLENDVHIKYAVSVDNLGTTDTLKLKINETEVLEVSGTTEKDGETLYVFEYTGLSAKQMTDTVYAKAFVDNGETIYESQTDKYSILEYAYNKLVKTEAEATEDEKLKTLLNTMLSYGASSQIYFNYKTDTLATDEFLYVKLENATFEDGFSYEFLKAGTQVRVFLKEGKQIDSQYAEFVEEDVNGDLILTMPASIPEKPQEHVHTWSEWTIVSQETCTTAGLEMRICQTDASHSEQRFIEPKHIIVNHEAKEPTCAEVGWETYESCSRCEYTTYVEIAKNENHDWVDGLCELPTCEEAGWEEEYCWLCKESRFHELPALGHKWKEEFNDTHHWTQCEICYYMLVMEEHIDDGFGNCSVCNIKMPPTMGILYEISSDGTSAEVVGYEGDERNVRIADTYQGVPVTTIGDSAFHACNMNSVVIPDSVITVGSYAFMNCQNLTNVKIGSSVTSISGSVFYWSNNLTNIEVSESNSNYKAIDGNLYSKDGKTLVKYASGKRESSFTIPSTVTTISNDAFEGSKLTTVVIPDSVKTIGSFAFEGCYNLKSIVIPDSVTSIGDHVFSNMYASDLIIYCEAESQPSGWDSDWNQCYGHSNGTDYCTVVWGYNKD